MEWRIVCAATDSAYLYSIKWMIDDQQEAGAGANIAPACDSERWENRKEHV